METVTASRAREDFGATLDRAIREPVMIERNGRPVAVIQSVEEFQRMKEAEDRELDRLEAAILKGFAPGLERFELTDELFERLMAGEFDNLESDGLALPPGYDDEK